MDRANLTVENFERYIKYEMPNRILRDWTASENVNNLDVHSERFFVRLIMKVDDYGRFSANVRLLNSTLFPLKSDIRDSDIARWLAACEKAGMITVYNDASKSYLQIENFNQTLRQKTTKYPSPEECLAYDTQVHSNGEASASLKRNETETRNEEEEEGEKTTPPKEKSFKQKTKEEFHNELKDYVEQFGKGTVSQFFNYWSETDTRGKMKFQKQDTWETKLRLITWKNKEAKWSK